jgi:hypothetical protein
MNQSTKIVLDFLTVLYGNCKNPNELKLISWK